MKGDEEKRRRLFDWPLEINVLAHDLGGSKSSNLHVRATLKLVARGFLRVLRFPFNLQRFNGSANKIS